jgi:hypothetical protein
MATMTTTPEEQQAWCEQLIERFQQRAGAVKKRPMPPLEGSSRKKWIDETQQSYMDYAIIGDCLATLENGVLTLQVDLRPTGERVDSVNIRGNNRASI